MGVLWYLQNIELLFYIMASMDLTYVAKYQRLVMLSLLQGMIACYNFF